MFTYEKYRKTSLWEKLDQILADLEENRDINITTHRDYVIGYFCSELDGRGFERNEVEAVT